MSATNNVPTADDLPRLVRVAELIGSIFFYGNFKAETYSEREIENELRALGYFFETEDELMAKLHPDPESELPATPASEKIRAACDQIKKLLLEKNAAYGNSALDPVRVFSKCAADEQLRVRIDDKLSRIARGHEYPGDDTINDLIGYLILYKIANQ